MGKKGRIAFAIVLAGVGILVWLVIAPREPRYEGRSLSSWIQQYHTNGWPLDKEAALAIQTIGTNANPILLKMMGRHESELRIKLTSHISGTWLTRLHISDLKEYRAEIDRYREHAANAFMALGEKARPAVPGLITLLNDKDQRVRYLAVFALRCLGPTAEDALPQLMKCLDDPLFEIKDDAVMSMGTIRKQPEIVVPRLMDFLEQNRREEFLCSDAMQALGNFGSDAKPAVPLLTTLTNDKRQSIQIAASNALMRIAPQPLTRPEDHTK